MANKFSKIENKQAWQDLLGKVLFKTFFHSWEWEEFLESQFKWLKFERYNWQDKALLSFAKARGKLISHPFCEYGGPLPLLSEIEGQAFKKDLFEEFKTPFKISFHPELLKYFKGIDFLENERETFFFKGLSQKSADEIWLTLDRNRRRSLKTAKEQGFKIEQCQSIKHLEKLYSLYVSSLKRHKALVYPFSFFKFFFQNPMTKILLVKKGEKVVGGNLFLFYGEITHSFLCGFEEKYRKLGAHSLVLWQAIQETKKENYQVFDFGATRKDSSIKEFKERWGAETYPIFELKNYAGDSKLKNSFLRDVWGHLPVSLIKFLSPHFIKYKL